MKPFAPETAEVALPVEMANPKAWIWADMYSSSIIYLHRASGL